MDINRKNYQEYFLDYFEKSLLPQKVAELMVFLEANPDLNKEFEAFEPLILEPFDIEFDNKQKLKKRNYETVGQITALNYEEWMVAGIEKDLSSKELHTLGQFISKNPDARLEYDLFLRTRLYPEKDVLYPEKDDLKKRSVFYLNRVLLYRVTAAAASLLLLLSVFLVNEYFSDNRLVSKSSVMNRLEAVSPTINFSSDIPAVGQRTTYADQNEVTDLVNIFVPNEINRQQAPGKLIAKHVNEISSPNDAPRSLEIIIRQNAELVPSNSEGFAMESEENNQQGSFSSRFVNGVMKNIFGKRKRSGKSLLEYTVDGYNLMADKEVEVEKEYDSSGNIVAYRVNGEVVKIGRKVNAPLGE